MNIQTADNISQLEEFVRTTRRKAKFKLFKRQRDLKFLGLKLDKKQNDWQGSINYHGRILYQDEIIDVKAPTILGKKLILDRRPKLEEKFNDSYIVKESMKEKLKRESDYLKKINNANLKRYGLKTFESRQELLQKFKKPLEDVLLTKYEQNLMPSDEFFKNSDVGFLKDYLNVLSKKLRLFHDSGFIWGDSRIANTGSTGKDIFIYDFEFKTNPNMSFEEKRIKDLVGFTLNAVGTQKMLQYETVKIIFNAYKAKDFSKQIIKETKKIKKIDFERQKNYFKPVHNLSIGSGNVAGMTLTALANQYI